jgi:thiol-disulfide isomerase/thioredoxin
MRPPAALRGRALPRRSFAPRDRAAFTLLALALCLPFALASPASASRTQIYSIVNIEDVQTGEQLATQIERLPGVQRARFGKLHAEMVVTLEGATGDDAVLRAVAAAGYRAIAGAGYGSYVAQPGYPKGADVRVVTNDGSMVGPLEKLRVAGKYTVLDVYAVWCGPCHMIDARLRELCATRKDIAVRKLNVVDFDTPLAGQLGPSFTALPHLIVFTPSGKRVEFEGFDLKRLDAALAAK